MQNYSYGSVKFTIRMAFLQIQHSFLTKMQNHNIHQLNSTKRAALWRHNEKFREVAVTSEYI
jgi:hypothetical protein